MSDELIVLIILIISLWGCRKEAGIKEPEPFILTFSKTATLTVYDYVADKPQPGISCKIDTLVHPVTPDGISKDLDTREFITDSKGRINFQLYKDSPSSIFYYDIAISTPGEFINSGPFRIFEGLTNSNEVIGVLLEQEDDTANYYKLNLFPKAETYIHLVQDNDYKPSYSSYPVHFQLSYSATRSLSRSSIKENLWGESLNILLSGNKKLDSTIVLDLYEDLFTKMNWYVMEGNPEAVFPGEVFNVLGEDSLPSVKFSRNLKNELTINFSRI